MKPAGRVVSARDPVAAVTRITEAASERQGLLCLDRNERVAPFPSEVAEELRERLASVDWVHYPNTDGLYEALISHYGRDRDRMLLTPGSDGGLRSLFQAYVAPGDSVAVVRPSYAMYEVYAQLAGATIRAVDCGADLRFDVAAFAALIDESTRLVLLANPNQPTGALLEEGDLAAIVGAASHAGALVAVDETYGPFAGVSALDAFGDHPNVLVLQSFSKAWGLAGLRVAAALGSPDVIKAMGSVRSVYDINAAAIVALEVLLRHPEVIDASRADVVTGKAHLAAGLRDLGMEPFPTAANFLVVRTDRVIEPQLLIDRLIDEGILVRGPFAHPCLEGCVRITLGPIDVMQQVLDATARAIAKP